jgi:hypothetical protein
VTKARACKGAGQEWAWESHFMLPWRQENEKEWTSTLPSELPLWELKSQWTSKSLERNFRGKNALDWNVPYIIGKLLERKRLKWVCMTHLDTSNASYGQKKGQESNWQLFPTTKSQESPRFLCAKVACNIPSKSSPKGLKLCFKIHLNLRSTHKIHTPKVADVPTLGISGLPLGSPGTKCHLGASPMAKHRIYYQREGGGFPQVRAVMSLVNPNLLVVNFSIKNVQTLH